MSKLTGWNLTWTITLAIGAGSAAIAAKMGFTVEAVQAVIRFTARTSFILFCLALSGAALYRLWPGAWTRWQRQNRRYLGVAFAVSHLIHALAIITFARLDPAQFHPANGAGMFVTGGIAYLFILLMAATSFDRSAAWLGPRAWRVLHIAGVHYIALSFLIAFGMRIPGSLAYAIPVAVLLAIYVVRAASWVKESGRLSGQRPNSL
jgi:DMSO/TMAO reductase YedYZ heme-binding membrane subunit